MKYSNLRLAGLLDQSCSISNKHVFIGAFQASFPAAVLSDCYFHHRESMDRKLQVIKTRMKIIVNIDNMYFSLNRHIGHQNRCQTNSTFAGKIRKIVALTFLKVYRWILMMITIYYNSELFRKNLHR